MATQRVAFFGSGPLGLATLKKLSQIPSVDLAFVVSGPDRRQGRGLEPISDVVVEYAKKCTFACHQPERLDENFTNTVESAKLDLAVVASFGHILPLRLLTIPRKGFLNVHPSLLPAFRGATPIATALREGCSTTGVTIIRMDEGVDSGPILKQVPFPIPPGIHRPELEAQLAQLGADLLSEALIPYLEGSLMPKDQSKIGISKTRRLTKDDGKIDWTESAVSIARKIQAYDPWPGTWTTWNGVVVKILLGDAVELTHTSPPGTAMSSEAYPLAVACGSGALRIDRIQLSGRKALGPSEFLLGQRGIIGAVLGS